MKGIVATVIFAIAIFAMVLLPVAAQAQTTSDQVGLGAAPMVANPPLNESPRYVLPYYYSTAKWATTPPDRSVTIIQVYNQATIPCDVTVEFQYGTATTDICSLTATIAPGVDTTFCSRLVSDPLFPCHNACSPGLTFHEGHAFIDSSNTFSDCANIAVDAELVWTRNIADTQVESMSHLNIVNINSKNNGD